VTYLYKTLLAFCLITPLFSQNSATFSLGPEYYSAKTGYQDASGISLAYLHQITTDVRLGLRFNYGTMSMNIASPSVNKAVNISAYDFYLVSAFTLAHKIFTMDIKTVTGAGIKVLEREAFIINLGALDREAYPQLTKSYFSSFLALVISKQISGNLGFFIEPAWAFYDLNALHSALSVRGGIDVSFN